MDDQRALNGKLGEAGFAARGLDEAAIELCSATKSDGYVSPRMLNTLAAHHEEKRIHVLVAKLIVAGRWHEAAGMDCQPCTWAWETRVLKPVPSVGWIIHDYGATPPGAKAPYNPMGDAERERLTERGRSGAAGRWSANGSSTRNAAGGASSDATSIANGSAPRARSPVQSRPVPTQKQLDAHEAEFAAVWAAYPRAKPSNRSVKGKSLTAYVTTRLMGATAEDLMHAVEAYGREQGHDPEHVMGCQVFFGPDERWRGMLDAAGANRRSRDRGGAFGGVNFR